MQFIKDLLHKGQGAQELALLLIQHAEGFRGQPYDDATAKKLEAPKGKVTIAYGRNTDANPLTPAEGLMLLKPAVQELDRQLRRKFAVYSKLSEVRQAVCIDMAYNLGLEGLYGFTHMWEALRAGNHQLAAKEMLDSRWAQQVGLRASRSAWMMVNNAIYKPQD